MAEIPGSLRYAVTGSTPVRANDRRQSPGARRIDGADFAYSAEVIVSYTGGRDTIARGTRAQLWGGGGTTLDLTSTRYVIFTVAGSGALSAAPQETWSAVSAANTVIGLEYSHWDGWQRWQMRAIVPVVPCLGANPTIALVAGGNAWGVSTDTTNGTVDGPLGTNMLSAPFEGQFGPDGKYYFIDSGTNFIRYYDPATGLVGTTAVSRDFSANVSSNPSDVFTIGPDGTFYFFVLDTSDSNNPNIWTTQADGTVITPAIFSNAPLRQLLGDSAGMFVAPDNSLLYVCVPDEGFDPHGGSAPTNVLAAISIGSTNVGSAIAGSVDGLGNSIPTLQGGGGSANDQGEDVAALSGMVGNAINCYAVGSDVYTIDNKTRMVRKIAGSTGHIRSITNHVPLNVAGGTQAGGYAGDGAPAFTLNDNTPQLGRFGVISVSVDPCGNVFIGDSRQITLGTTGTTALVRYVDIDGILHTLAGTYPDLDNNMPTSTSSPAIGKTIYDCSWIAWGPDGALYVSCTFFDGVNVSANCIYRIASS